MHNSNNYIPWQWYPSPLNPSAHKHKNDPTALIHTASRWQLCCPSKHSFTSATSQAVQWWPHFKRHERLNWPKQWVPLLLYPCTFTQRHTGRLASNSMQNNLHLLAFTDVWTSCIVANSTSTTGVHLVFTLIYICTQMIRTFNHTARFRCS